jgi:hypothetical protein
MFIDGCNRYEHGKPVRPLRLNARCIEAIGTEGEYTTVTLSSGTVYAFGTAEEVERKVVEAMR